MQVVGHGNVIEFIAGEREAGRADPTVWFKLYLRSVYSRWQDLPLERLVTDAAGRGEGVKLPALFTPLDVYEPSETFDFYPQSKFARRPTERDEEEADGGRGRHRIPVVAHLANERLMVVTGEPGGGKSSVARYLVVCNAGAMLGADIGLDALTAAMATRGPRELRALFKTAWPHPALVPIYIELRHFASDTSEAKGLFPPMGDAGDCRHFLKFLRHRLGEDEALDAHVYEAIIGVLNQDSPEGRGAGLLIVLDGLDEVDDADGRRERLKQVIERLADQFPGVRILVTSRTYAYRRGSPWRLSERFVERELATYDTGQMERYVRRWYDEAARRRPAAFAERRAAEFADDLVAQLRQERHVGDLGGRPLILAMITLLHDQRGGKLPRGGRTALYDETVELLTDRWINERGRKPLTDGLGLTLDSVRLALERIAFRVHMAARITATAAEDVPFGVLCEELERVRSESRETIDHGRMRQRLAHRAGILVADSDEVYRFPHRSFQEYLAAMALVGQSRLVGEWMPLSVGQPVEPSEGWTFPENFVALLRSDPERWREAGLFAGGWAARDLDKAWSLIDALVGEEIPADAGSPEWWRAWVAIRVLAEHDNMQPQRPSQEGWLARTRQWCGALLDAGALPPVDRASAGRALAAIGDDRPGVGCDGGMPNIVWYPPLDREPLHNLGFWMGSETSRDPTAHEGEGPRHRAQAEAAFRISRYPITVAQFEPFVAEGYRVDRHWTVAGLAWRGEKATTQVWNDRTWHVANHPVVAVTWYEATAYCAWLSEQLGFFVRLPTETEWEFAARGTDGRRFPWGDAFDAERCNMDETGIDRTSPVGMFPLPDGPWGADGPLDMSGNVWEWCASTSRDRYKGEEDNNREGESARVLRGGAFHNSATRVRCAFRYWYDPDFAFSRVGFRVVAPFSSGPLASDPSDL